MTNVLYEVAHVDYDEYIFLGLYSSLRGALDCFFKKQDNDAYYENANYIKVVILNSDEAFTLYTEPSENRFNYHYIELGDVVQLTRVDMIDDDEKKLFEIKKILARYTIWNHEEFIKRMENEIKNNDLNDQQIAFKERQIERVMQDKNELIQTFVPELKNIRNTKKVE